MHAIANCPSCKKQLRVQEFLAGKQASCPSCETVLDIPASLFREPPRHAPLPPRAIRVDQAKQISPPAANLSPRGAPLSVHFRRFMSSGRVKLLGGMWCLAAGITAALFGLLIGLTARAHSPHMSFFQMTRIARQDPDYLILNEPAYQLLCVVAVGLGLTGMALLLFGVILVGIWAAHHTTRFQAGAGKLPSGC
ncbi:MAG: hypothetical protein WEA04_05175 [Candidatus Andersenbacteria bacterium]